MTTHKYPDSPVEYFGSGRNEFQSSSPDELVASIVRANAALPDDDRRKIGWDYVDRIRHAGNYMLSHAERLTAEGADIEALAFTADGAALIAISDGLASYLLPRPFADSFPRYAFEEIGITIPHDPTCRGDLNATRAPDGHVTASCSICGAVPASAIQEIP